MSSRILVTASLTAALLLGMLPPLHAKRLPPPEVKPVVAGGVEYRAEHERFAMNDRPAGLRAFVEARDAKTKTPLWKVKVYEIVYQGGLETDAQEVYIASLKMTPKGLVVGTEKKVEYLVDLTKKTAKRLPATKQK
jgi:hypothetical protein